MKHKKISCFFLFLVVNFLALGIGSYLMNNGPRSQWYLNLNKAPWTPPGFLFGIAWSLIMVCFASYMTTLTFKKTFLSTDLIILYGFQWLLNVGWNYSFFGNQWFVFGFYILIILQTVLLFMLIKYFRILKKSSFLLFPYLFWMAIAISLNGYIILNN